MQDFELSVTICSWNTREDLRLCLESLRRVRGEVDFEVIVVDNASKDGSGAMVAEQFPEFRLLQQTENLGFCRGHNLALQERRGRDAMLLNSDTVVHPGALRALMEVRRARPEVGILGPKLKNPDGSLQFSCRRFPNPIAAAFRNTFLGRWFPQNKFTREYLMQDWSHDQLREVDWLSGAAMIVTHEVIEKVGVLDPNLFMFCEDVDLCKRAWEQGFKVVYVPTGEITHAIGRSTDQVANKMIVRFHRSMLRYYTKHNLRESFVLLRPGLWCFAATALTIRASLFLLKNGLDALRRRISR